MLGTSQAEYEENVKQMDELCLLITEGEKHVLAHQILRMEPLGTTVQHVS